MKEFKLITFELARINEDTGKIDDQSSTLLNLIDIILSGNTGMPQTEIPKGKENYLLVKRLSKAFKEAKESEKVLLDEKTYNFIENKLFKYLPAAWARNEGAEEAVDAFYSAKTVEKEVKPTKD